jgi:hypothetical protein
VDDPNISGTTAGTSGTTAGTSGTTAGASGPGGIDTDGETATGPARKNVARVQYPKWVWAFAVIGGLVVLGCIYLIVQLNESNAVDTGNGAIEQLVPAPATQILSQADVGVDLAPGYTARLTLNGIPIADDEVRRVEATNSVLFLPGPGRSVEEFTPGQNCMTAEYWKPVEGEASAQKATWCFEAL